MDIMAFAGIALTLVGAWPFFRQYQRRRRVRDGKCLHCGYAIAGLTTRQCPECGKSTQVDLPENRKLLYESPLKNFRWP